MKETPMGRHDILTDGEMKAIMREIREKGIEPTFADIGTNNPIFAKNTLLGVVVPNGSFPKRTPWLNAKDYGIRFETQPLITHLHWALKIALINDETHERKEFIWSACPAAVLAYPPYPNVLAMVGINLLENQSDRIRHAQFMLMTEQMAEMIEKDENKHMGILDRMAKSEVFAKWAQENLTVITNCDMRSLLTYISTVVDLVRKIPATEGFCAEMLHAPCNLCGPSIREIRRQGKVMSKDQFDQIVPKEVQDLVVKSMDEWEDEVMKDRR
jgi:hypothetical protein